MQGVINFIVENFVLILVIFIGIFTYSYYKKSQEEILKKVAGKKSKVVFTRTEYRDYKRQSELVLNNTTISFIADNIHDQTDKMNMYYNTVSIGNQIIKLQKFSISDVGEI